MPPEAGESGHRTGVHHVAPVGGGHRRLSSGTQIAEHSGSGELGGRFASLVPGRDTFSQRRLFQMNCASWRISRGPALLKAFQDQIDITGRRRRCVRHHPELVSPDMRRQPSGQLRHHLRHERIRWRNSWG